MLYRKVINDIDDLYHIGRNSYGCCRVHLLSNNYVPNQTKTQVMTITAERFVKCAWTLDFRITSAESRLLDSDFISTATALAQANEINVQYIDFSCYRSPEVALASNTSFLNAVEDGTKPRLLWFDNCDCLAPLDCSLTYSLRSLLTTRQSSNIQSVFIARQSSLELMFFNHEGAFFQSNFSITATKS